MEWLARRPGHYQQVTDLLEEVWGAPRSRTAVRTVISNLRSRLRRAGMGDLASRIDGHCQGHYRLALPANHVPGERTDRKQTATRPKADSSVRAFGGEAHEAR